MDDENADKYEDWETGTIDLAVVAAHAAAELAALERGELDKPEALEILVKFLTRLGEAGADQGVVAGPLTQQLTALRNAIGTSDSDAPKQHKWSELIQKAAQMAAQLKAPNDSQAHLRAFCLALSRFAMTPAHGEPTTSSRSSEYA